MHEKAPESSKTLRVSLFLVDCIHEVNAYTIRLTRLTCINPKGFLEPKEGKAGLINTLMTLAVKTVRNSVTKVIDQYVKGTVKVDGKTLLFQTLLDNMKVQGSEIGVAYQRKKELIQAATFVQKCSYVPYSQHPIGCAILGGNGTIYTGCTVEHNNMLLRISAEQAAIAQV